MYNRTALKILPFCFLFLFSTTFSSNATALTYFSEEGAVVTGIVTSVGKRSFSLDSGEVLFDVSLEDLELDTNLMAFLSPGTKIAVRGVMESQAFGNPVIEAKKMLMVNSSLSEVEATQMLLYEENRSRRYRLN